MFVYYERGQYNCNLKLYQERRSIKVGAEVSPSYRFPCISALTWRNTSTYIHNIYL